MFSQDQIVVYPAQGVGKIELLEHKEIGGQNVEFYIIRIISSNITVMVPVVNAKAVGLRGLSSKKEVKKVLEYLKERGSFTGYTGQNWNRRYREYTDRLKSPSLLDVCYVLKELILISAEKELSFGERRLQEQAMGLITSELSYVLDSPADEIKKEIESFYEDLLPSPENLE